MIGRFKAVSSWWFAVACALAVLVVLACMPFGAAHAAGGFVAAQDDVTAAQDDVTAGQEAAAETETHEPASKVRIAEGAYTFNTALGKKLGCGLSGKSAKSGAQLALKKAAGQKSFYVRPEGQDRYSIQLVAEGLFLTEEGGKVVLRAWSGDEQQLWWATGGGSTGVSFVNVDSGNAISVAGGKAKSGAKLVAETFASKKAQRWKLTSKKLMSNGWYRLRSALGTYLSVSGAGYKNGESVAAKKKSANGSQCFQVKAVGSAYRIENARSFKSVAVKGGSKREGADVVQQTSSKAKARLWKISLDHRGRYVLLSAKSGKALSVKGDSRKSGANVVQRGVDESKGQAWQFVSANRYSLSGNKSLDRGIAKILAKHDTLKSAYTYVRDKMKWADPDTAYRSGKYMSAANTKRYAKEMIKNGKGSCYCSSSLFMWLARGLGYKAKVTVGYMQSNTPGLVGAHSWVEVRKGGKVYVCDPDLGRAYPSRDWFMKLYKDAPAEYNFW